MFDSINLDLIQVLSENYPRGHKELRGSFFDVHGPQDTICWFSDKGVELKVGYCVVKWKKTKFCLIGSFCSLEVVSRKLILFFASDWTRWKSFPSQQQFSHNCRLPSSRSKEERRYALSNLFGEIYVLSNWTIEINHG